MKEQITAPRDLLIDGKHDKQGKALPASSTSSQVRAFLRFIATFEVIRQLTGMPGSLTLFTL
jgi:hypothetical protein